MSTPTPPNLLGLRPEDLAQLLPLPLERALPVARRVLAHLISYGHTDIRHMKRPPTKRVRDWIEANTTWGRLEVVERVPDGVDHSVLFTDFERAVRRLCGTLLLTPQAQLVVDPTPVGPVPLLALDQAEDCTLVAERMTEVGAPMTCTGTTLQ